MNKLLEIVQHWVDKDEKHWGLTVTEDYGDIYVTWYEDTDCCDLRNTVRITDIIAGHAYYYDAGMIEEIYFNVHRDLDKLHQIIEDNTEPCFVNKETEEDDE